MGSLMNNLNHFWSEDAIVQEGNSIVLRTQQSQLLDALIFLKTTYSYLWLIDLVVEEEPGKENLQLRYYLFDLEVNQLVCLKVNVHANDIIPSINHFWTNASSLEGEASELFGIEFNRKYKKRYSFKDGLFPGLKSFSGRIQVDPGSVETIFENGHTLKMADGLIKYKLMNNLVEKASIISGRYHIGLEKNLEKCSLRETYSYLENYFFTHSAEWSHLLSQTVETHYNIQIPERAQVIRMALLELNRITMHINFLLKVSVEFKFEFLYAQSQLWMKRLQSLLLSYSGNEYSGQLIRVGGVTKDVSQVWLSRTVLEMSKLEKGILKVYHFLLKESYIKSSFNFSLISKDDALCWSATGPIARSAGLNIDFRKISPLYFYNDVEFEVPIGARGTAYDLLLIRIEEIFQSLNILNQILDNIPMGRIMNRDDYDFFSGSSDELEDQGLFKKSVTSYLDYSNIYSFNFLEGANGLMSMYLNKQSADDGRLKLTSSSFFFKDLYEKVSKDNELDHVIPLWTLMDINMKEVER